MIARSIGSSVHSIVTSAGTVKVGGVLSTILIICSQMLAFPASSVAVKVLVSVPVLPPQPSNTKLSSKETTGLALQTSVAVAIPVLAGSVLSPQPISIGLGGQTIIGASLSTASLIVKSAVVEQPFPSVTATV